MSEQYPNYQLPEDMSWMDNSTEHEPLSVYTAKTFGWMFWGLLATFLTAYVVYISRAVNLLLVSPYLPFVLLIAEVVVVIALSARLKSMHIGTARMMFFIYAILNGVTFSTFFVIYDLTTLIYVFGLAALYFGVLALYGYFTKRDLSSLRPILFAGALFLLAFWVISMFLPMTGFERIACFIGLAIFMGYTAYDTQKIKMYHQAFSHNPEMAAKASIISALQLYLDFINIFLYILRLVGRRSNN